MKPFAVPIEAGGFWYIQIAHSGTIPCRIMAASRHVAQDRCNELNRHGEAYTQAELGVRNTFRIMDDAAQLAFLETALAMAHSSKDTDFAIKAKEALDRKKAIMKFMAENGTA